MLLNRQRANDYMREYDLDALIATSSINITYFTGYHCWLNLAFLEYMTSPGASPNYFQAYALLPREGEPALVVDPLFAVNAADTGVHNLYVYGDPGLDTSLPAPEMPANLQRISSLFDKPAPATATDALLQIVKEHGLTGARIGLDTEGLSDHLQATLRQALPRASILGCSNLIRLIRMVKSDEEMARMIRSAEINEIAALESLALARPGGSIRELVHHFRRRVGDLGADVDHYAFGMRGLGLATEPDYILAEEDFLYVDFGCKYHYYLSDSGTTLALRPLSSQLADKHAALRDCIHAGLASIRPGIKASQARSAMWEVLASRGITTSYPHGHGLGLQARDYPILVPDNGLRIRDDCVDIPSDLPLEAGMVLNLESLISLSGLGSLHTEQSLIVTEGGNRPLIAQARETPYVPAG